MIECMGQKLPSLSEMVLDVHGARLFPPLSVGIQRDLKQAVRELAPDQAGIRLFGKLNIRPLLAQSGPIGTLAASLLGERCRPVRAILFDKTAKANWSLGWHQDRTIAVAERVAADGFGPWSVKGGVVHVEPPFELLERMITVRVHFDPVPATNAPLLIAPGSHRLGRIPITQIAGVVQRCGTVACLASAGDVWVYSTPILHASDAAQSARHRRVLQVDYAATDLPDGLQWLGV
jgi:hypothetical protein